MVTRNYTHKTDFDQALDLHVTEVVSDRKTEARYYGFRSLDEAKAYADWWTDKWHFGYMGYATAFTDPDGRFFVDTTRYNSCD